MASNSVYLEIVDFFASGTTPQTVIDFKPSAVAQQRALDLLELSKQANSLPNRNQSWNISPSWSTSFAWPKLALGRFLHRNSDLARGAPQTGPVACSRSMRIYCLLGVFFAFLAQL